MSVHMSVHVSVHMTDLARSKVSIKVNGANTEYFISTFSI